MKLDAFPRYPLTFGPSPVHHLRRLSEYLGGASVWAKREDVNSGLAFGGNKVRKLEYIVPDIVASRRRHAGVNRRLPVQPHSAGRRGRRAPWPSLSSGAGEVGAVGGPGQRQGRQHSAVAG